MRDTSGRAGCTYGDTNHNSISVEFGHNLAIDNIVTYLTKESDKEKKTEVSAEQFILDHRHCKKLGMSIIYPEHLKLMKDVLNEFVAQHSGENIDPMFRKWYERHKFIKDALADDFEQPEEKQPLSAREFIIRDCRTRHFNPEITWNDLEKSNLAYDIHGTERLMSEYAAHYEGVSGITEQKINEMSTIYAEKHGGSDYGLIYRTYRAGMHAIISLLSGGK